MRVKTPQIAFHWDDADGKPQPLFCLSLDFHPSGRVVTSGSDRSAKIWKYFVNEAGEPALDYRDSLKHDSAVNVARFSPNGEMLATGADGGKLYLWGLRSLTPRPTDDRSKETWSIIRTSQAHSQDIYDLRWSPCSKFILTCSTDNSAVISTVADFSHAQVLKDHRHFVQGVCWDPMDTYVASMSADRSCRVYRRKAVKGPSSRKRVSAAAAPSATPSSSSDPSSASSSSSSIPSSLPLAIDPPLSQSPSSSATLSSSSSSSSSSIPLSSSLGSPVSKTSSVSSSFTSSEDILMLSPVAAASSSSSSSQPHSQQPTRLYSGEFSLFSTLCKTMDPVLLDEKIKQEQIQKANQTPTSRKRKVIDPTAATAADGREEKKEASASPDSMTIDLITPPSASSSSSEPPSLPPVPVPAAPSEPKPKQNFMFHNEFLSTFFRRPDWSPDGAFLVAPSAQWKPFPPSSVSSPASSSSSSSSPLSPLSSPSMEDASFVEKEPSSKTQNTIIAFARSDLSRPAAHFPGHAKAALAIRFSPILYKLSVSSKDNWSGLPYRCVFAAVTADTLIILDTQHSYPLATIGNIHYDLMTDVAWSCDGRTIGVSSNDGYCTFVQFDDGELGEPLPLAECPVHVQTQINAFQATAVAMAVPVAPAVVEEQQAPAAPAAPAPVTVLTVRKKVKPTAMAAPGSSSSSLAHVPSAAVPAPVVVSAPVIVQVAPPQPKQQKQEQSAHVIVIDD